MANDDGKSWAEKSALIGMTKDWVPGVGWKKIANFTRADLLAQADWYERQAARLIERASWNREVAALMEREAAETVGDLTCDLPAFDPLHDLDV
jgi:hypothetical protein